MTHDEYVRKLQQMNRVLNDPDVPMQPALIWSLLAELSQHDSKAGIRPQAAIGHPQVGCRPSAPPAEDANRAADD